MQIKVVIARVTDVKSLLITASVSEAKTPGGPFRCDEFRIPGKCGTVADAENMAPLGASGDYCICGGRDTE